MRVAELDRDMSAVFPQGLDRPSEFLYEQMREATYELLRVNDGEHVLDAAAGLGNDGQNLAELGLRVTNAEPSERMTGLAAVIAEKQGWKDWGGRLTTVRAWCERMPFPDGAFRAVFCKGSLDHFDDPSAGIAEMARVTAPDGRVVLSVVNMDSLGCRLLAWRDRYGPRRRHRHPRRRHQDAPADHYTRYDSALVREQAAQHIHVEECRGVSLLWGVEGWKRLIEALPPAAGRRLLALADALAARLPALADVVVVAGRPRLRP